MIGYIQLLLIFSYPDKNFHFFNHFNTNVPGPKHAQKKNCHKEDFAPQLFTRVRPLSFMQIWK